MEASDSLRQKKIKFFCPILDTSTCLQTYLLQQHGKKWNESQDTSIFNGAFWYRSYPEYIYAFGSRGCQGRTWQIWKNGLKFKNIDTTKRKPKWKKSFVKWENRSVLIRFLLNLDDKIYEFMPQYATKTKKILYHSKSYKVAWNQGKSAFSRSF